MAGAARWPQHVQHAGQADHERRDRVQVAPAQVARSHDAADVTPAQAGRQRGDQQDRDRLLVAPHARQERMERAARGVAQRGHGQRPEQAGQHVERGEPHEVHAGGAAGRGDRDAQAVRVAAGHQQPAAAPRGELDETPVARALPEAAIEPRTAAASSELVVDLVGQRVAGERHRDQGRQMEEPALGQEGRGQQHRLALHGHAEEHEGVAVLEKERLHHGRFGS
jgi:hypothetical protein